MDASPPKTLEVGTRMLGPLIDHLDASDADGDAVLAKVGLSRSAFEDPDGRIDGMASLRLWDVVAAAMDDPCLGLNVASRVTKDSFDVVSQVAAVSQTFREVGERINRYYALVSPVPLYELREEGDWAWWVMPKVFPGGFCVRHLCEFTVAVGWVYARQWSGDQCKLRQVHFDHPAATSEEPYRAFFDAPVHFARQDSGFELPSAQLDMSLTHSDAALGTVLERFADASVEDVEAEPDNLSTRIRTQLDQRLAGGDLGLDSVARALGTSGRSLQRRLGEEGASFQELLDTLRNDRALQYMASPDSSVDEVTFRLGFSDAGAFRRAFKRWTGSSPRQYRARQTTSENTSENTSELPLS